MENVLGLGVAALFVMGIVFMVNLVMATSRKETAPMVISFVGACSFFFLGGIIAFNYGKQVNTTLTPGHSYIVQGRGSSEFGSPLFVYDVNERRNLVVDSKEYPPKGFSEERIGGGEIALAPLLK